jgi:aldose 1-epimerase
MFWNKNLEGRSYGEIEGKEVVQYQLKNKNGLSASIITYGAILTNLLCPDKDGNLSDILIGFESLEGYKQVTNPYMNSIVGRVANRINNARYVSGGETIDLNKNNGKHQLHGGIEGFDKKIWDVVDVSHHSISLQYVSMDGEEGFPGEVTCKVKYELDDDNRLHIIYNATPTRTTPIILTHHAYFNLSGGGEADILNHEIQISAKQILETDRDLLPTGGFIEVKNSPFDLNKSTLLSSVFEKIEGYDHFWVFVAKEAKPTKVARLSHEKSGRYLDTYTTEPGMQVYTANGWDGKLIDTKGGRPYQSYAGICLETQMLPDSMNHPHFPSPFIEGGEGYYQHTVYEMGVL